MWILGYSENIRLPFIIKYGEAISISIMLISMMINTLFFRSQKFMIFSLLAGMSLVGWIGFFKINNVRLKINESKSEIELKKVGFGKIVIQYNDAKAALNYSKRIKGMELSILVSSDIIFIPAGIFVNRKKKILKLGEKISSSDNILN